MANRHMEKCSTSITNREKQIRTTIKYPFPLVRMKVKVTQSCPTLCDPLDYTFRGILQARILEWVAIPFSRGSLLQGIFPTQWSYPGLLHCRQILYQLIHNRNPRILEWLAYPFSRGSSWPRISCIASGFFTSWAIRKAPGQNGHHQNIYK